MSLNIKLNMVGLFFNLNTKCTLLFLTAKQLLQDMLYLAYNSNSMMATGQN